MSSGAPHEDAAGTRTSAEVDTEDPRVVRSKAAVLRATIELLAEEGYSGTTIEGIADRSGVAKTTIYRHWPARGELLFDAFDAIIQPVEPPDTGDLRRDLVTLLGVLADALQHAEWAGVIPALIEAAHCDDEVASLAAEFAHLRRRPLRSVLDRAVERGAVSADVDVDLVAHLLAAPLFYRRLLSNEPITATFVEALVDQVLPSLGSG